jgi:hypothetical protein
MRAWLPALLSLLLIPVSFAVTLAWGPSDGAAGYKLYYGTAPRNYTAVVDVGNSTTGRVTNLPVGVPHYFAVTAYNVAGESGYSEEVSFTPGSLPPPRVNILPPLVTVELQGATVLTGRWDMITSTQMFFRARVQETP